MENIELFNYIEWDKDSFVLSKSVTIFSLKYRVHSMMIHFIFFSDAVDFITHRVMCLAKEGTKFFEQYKLDQQDTYKLHSQKLSLHLQFMIMNVFYNTCNLNYNCIILHFIHHF